MLQADAARPVCVDSRRKWRRMTTAAGVERMVMRISEAGRTQGPE